jgi:hypothetical protein
VGQLLESDRLAILAGTSHCWVKLLAALPLNGADRGC